MTLEEPASLGPDDVRVGDAYEAVRSDERRRIAELKRPRRIHLGDALELVFENRETIRSTVQEALRTERIEAPDRVADEIAAFNAVVPAPGELAAALFLEVADPADINAAVMRFEGIEQAVFIEVAGMRTRGVPEEVFPRGESAVAHYLRFRLEPEQREAILKGSAVVAGSDHPSCTVTVALDEDQRHAIAADL
ncbi:MAG: DUF3501 family protein [Candidatus Dormiibacterota bacterium]